MVGVKKQQNVSKNEPEFCQMWRAIDWNWYITDFLEEYQENNNLLTDITFLFNIQFCSHFFLPPRHNLFSGLQWSRAANNICVDCAEHYSVSNILLGNMRKSYRSGTLNSNTVNSKFHLIRSFFQIFARFPIISCLKITVNSNTVNLK